jgi:translation initiation factor 2B subunit (eIF-2B alpha/beta/delta family)
LYCSKETAAIFAEAGIPTSLIVDSAMGVAMESVDLCIVGAEGVMENGGIVNTVSYLGYTYYILQGILLRVTS